MDDLSTSDVARFRLLANSISKPGNEKMDLGVHDINILFSARAEGMKLGERETQCLARLGLQHLSNENVPLWCWYSDLSDSRLGVALASAFIGANDDEKVGAISVLSSLAHELPTDDGFITREGIINVWFSEDSSPRVKSAALGYLAKNGAAEDFAVAKKEYDRSDHWTSSKALECMIGILLRTGQDNLVQQLVLESQFESLDADMLQAVLDGFENMETEVLLPGLEHRNAKVRLRTLKVLLGRGSLDHGMAERLSADSDAFIRNEAVMALSKLGRSFTEEEVKKILIRPKKQTLLAMSMVGAPDPPGKEFFARYQLESLKNTLRRNSLGELKSDSCTKMPRTLHAWKGTSLNTPRNFAATLMIPLVRTSKSESGARKLTLATAPPLRTWSRGIETWETFSGRISPDKDWIYCVEHASAKICRGSEATSRVAIHGHRRQRQSTWENTERGQTFPCLRMPLRRISAGPY